MLADNLSAGRDRSVGGDVLLDFDDVGIVAEFRCIRPGQNTCKNLPAAFGEFFGFHCAHAHGGARNKGCLLSGHIVPHSLIL